MELDPRNSVALVKSTARRLYHSSRNAALRESLELDDFEQELWIIWMGAARKYDAALGYAFATYFVTACENHILALSKKNGKRVQARGFTEEECEVGFADETSDQETVEERMEMDRVLASCDPRLAVILRLLSEDAHLLQAEDAALRAKARFAKEQGFDRIEAGITLPDLFKLVGVSRAWGYRMVGDLKETLHG